MHTFDEEDFEAVRRFHQYLENVDLPPEFEAQLAFLIDNLYGLAGKVDPEELEREKAEGESESVHEDFLYAVFDQRHLVQGRRRKWYKPNTNLGDTSGYSRRTKKKRVCFHHTAIYEGVGPRKRAIRAMTRLFEELADKDKDPYELDGGTGLWLARPTQELTKEQWARAMALALRYRGDPPQKGNYGMPYHGVSAANSVLYLNLPFEFVTWHGHGANNWSAGFAWDANSLREEVTPERAADLIYDVERFIEYGRSEGNEMDEFEIHAQYSRKPSDPGAAFIEKVMMPAAESTGSVLRMDFKANKPGTRTIEEVLRAA